jgi:hypothetical protein
MGYRSRIKDGTAKLLLANPNLTAEELAAASSVTAKTITC